MASDAEGKLGEVKDSLMRTAAEYENYRKRTQKENEAAFGNGVSYAACELLPVLDTVEAAAGAESSDEEYKKGVLLILDKSREVFKKMGIEEIDALGQPFDPALHNAVMQEEVESAESGTVTRVMQKGYAMHGRVIRHAMVAVAP
jgi:molecular chaperone GrpE